MEKFGGFVVSILLLQSTRPKLVIGKGELIYKPYLVYALKMIHTQKW